MAFMISNRNFRFGMRAFCDCCGKEVFDGDCNVLADREIGDGENARIVIACKVGCTLKIDPHKKMANQELGACVIYLINNAKINIEETVKWLGHFN